MNYKMLSFFNDIQTVKVQIQISKRFDVDLLE